jgi:hypothetical protein
MMICGVSSRCFWKGHPEHGDLRGNSQKMSRAGALDLAGRGIVPVKAIPF